jgi:predicted RecA/RadA family phage recombinase
MNYHYPLLVIGSFESRDAIEELLRALRAAGFRDEMVSIAYHADDLAKDPTDEPQRESSEKMRDLAKGAVSGGVVLGAVGGLIGLASLAIPGFGFLLVGGPLAVALGDAVAGGAVGAIAGALIGMRIPELKAKDYEESTKNELGKAREILEGAGAQDLHEVAVESVKEGSGELKNELKPDCESASATLEEAEQDATDPTHEKEIPSE